jgi:hypothetical protein
MDQRPICTRCGSAHLQDTELCINCRLADQKAQQEIKRQAFELDEDTLLSLAVEKVDKSDLNQYTGLNEVERFVLITGIKLGQHRVHKQAIFGLYSKWAPTPIKDTTFYKLLSKAIGKPKASCYRLELDPFLKGLKEGTLHLKGMTVYNGPEGTPVKRLSKANSKKAQKIRPSTRGTW